MIIMVKHVENLTNKELLTEWMLAKGFKSVPARTSKYACFLAPNGLQYFVGSHGALRRGKSVSDSISLTPTGRLSDEALAKFRRDVTAFRESQK